MKRKRRVPAFVDADDEWWEGMRVYTRLPGTRRRKPYYLPSRDAPLTPYHGSERQRRDRAMERLLKRQ